MSKLKNEFRGLKRLSNVFGREGTDPDYAAGEYAGPKNYYTQFSSLEDGRLKLDPSIRSLQETALKRTGEGLGDYLTRSEDIRNRFLGNQSAFRQARLNPLQSQMAQRRGEIQRSIGLRGLGGSSFGEQSLTGFDVESQRALADQSAIAEMEDLQALTGLDTQRLGAIIDVGNIDMNTAMARLNEEMTGLGMAQGQIQAAMTAFEMSQQRKLQQLQNIAKSAETWHTLVTDWGDFASIGKGKGGKKPEAGGGSWGN